MPDLSHLDALMVRLLHEKQRLLRSKSKRERELREVWVAGVEKEIKNEMDFLSGGPVSEEINKMTDDELIAALLAP